MNAAGEQPNALPGEAEVEEALGVGLGALGGIEKSVRQVLGNDTGAISALRCLKLYLERLGCDFQHAGQLHIIAGWRIPVIRMLLRVPSARCTCVL